MRIFAAIERILLDRWRKTKIALKINKWPLLSLREQQLQLKKQYLESLLHKKWHKFVKPYTRPNKVRIPPYGIRYNREGQSQCDARFPWDSRQQGRRAWWTRVETRQVRAAVHTHTQHGRRVRLLQNVSICWLLSLRPVSISIRLRLTIMCDSFGMCGTAQISTQSQIGRL